MKLSFKSYQRKLKVPIKMSRGVIDYREGVILRLEGNELAFSEVLILDYFGTESLKKSLEILNTLPSNICADDLDKIPEDCFATRFALEALFFTPESSREMKVSKLLPAGQAAIMELKKGLEEGFTTFKWKIASFENEFEIFDEMLSISDQVKYRLDANSGLDFNLTSKWLKFCEDKPVEFIEQPLPIEQFSEVLFLSKEYKVPIALDESVARFEDILRAYAKGWTGFYVVKPLRLGNLRDFLNWREVYNIKIVYSSALETVFGAQIAKRIAASDKQNDYALGFGVSHFFQSDGLEDTVENWQIKTDKLELIWQRL